MKEGGREGRQKGREGGREGGREREGGKGGREGGREGGIEGGTFIHKQYIHTPTYIIMHTLICTLTAAASWQVRLFRHALADLVTVDTQ